MIVVLVIAISSDGRRVAFSRARNYVYKRGEANEQESSSRLFLAIIVSD